MELREWTNLPDKMRTKEVRKYYNILVKRSAWFRAKRILDVIVASIMFAVLALPMLIVAVLIKLDSPGPVFFRQERVTQYGRIFRIYKFRTMVNNASRMGTQVTVSNDARITRVGRWLRKLRIDEFPQLFNILKGEMSLVGPRPEWKTVVDKYVEVVPEFALRTKVKAGLTGYAQVYGKYSTTPYDKVRLDIKYIENYSLWLDLKLILLTVKILFKKDKTEGVDEYQSNALRNESADNDKKQV